MKRSHSWAGALFALVLMGGIACTAPASASGWTDTRLTVAVEAGLPLVLGVDATYTPAHPWRLGLALGRIGGLTALRGEVHRMLAVPAPRRIVPYLLAGTEQYFLRDGDRTATPLGVHAGIGADYCFDSPVSLGVRLGGLKTFGSSGGGDLKVFSVQNGFTTGTMSMALRYYF